MTKSLLRTNKELAEIYERHKNTLYRVCFAYMKNPADTEDTVQDTFFQLIKTGKAFENKEHEKAWLIRTAINLCKNALKSKKRRQENAQSNERVQETETELDEVLETVLGLPDKYKAVIYLYYYEGYNSAEISKILAKPKSTIRNHLHEARGILREKLKGDFDYEEETD